MDGKSSVPPRSSQFSVPVTELEFCDFGPGPACQIPRVSAPECEAPSSKRGRQEARNEFFAEPAFKKNSLPQRVIAASPLPCRDARLSLLYLTFPPSLCAPARSCLSR